MDDKNYLIPSYLGFFAYNFNTNEARVERYLDNNYYVTCRGVHINQAFEMHFIYRKTSGASELMFLGYINNVFPATGTTTMTVTQIETSIANFVANDCIFTSESTFYMGGYALFTGVKQAYISSNQASETLYAFTYSSVTFEAMSLVVNTLESFAMVAPHTV